MANGPITHFTNSFESNDLQSNLINFEPFSLGKTAVQRLDETKGNYVKNITRLAAKSNEFLNKAIHDDQAADVDDKCVNSKSSNVNSNSVPNESSVALSINNNNSSLKDMNKTPDQTTKLLNSLLNTNGEHNRPLTSIILSNNLNKKFNLSPSNPSNQFAIKSVISSPQHKRKANTNRERKQVTSDENEHMMNLETQLKLLICIDHHQDSHLPTFSSSSTSEGPSSNCSRPSSICSSPISPSVMKSAMTKSSALLHQKANQKSLLSVLATKPIADTARQYQKKANNKSILSTSILTVNSKLPSLASISKVSKFTSKVCSKVNSKLNSKSSSTKASSPALKVSPASCEANVQQAVQASNRSDMNTGKATCSIESKSTVDSGVIISKQSNQGSVGIKANVDNHKAIDSSHSNEHLQQIENQIKHHENKQSNLPASPVVESRETFSKDDQMVSTTSQLISSNGAHCSNDLQKAIPLQSELQNKLAVESIKIENLKKPVERCSMMLKSDSATKSHYGQARELIIQRPVMTSLEPVTSERCIIRNLNKSLSLGTNLNNLTKVNSQNFDGPSCCPPPDHKTTIYDNESTGRIDLNQNERQANRRLTNSEMKETGPVLSNESTKQPTELHNKTYIAPVSIQAVSRSKSDIGHRVDRRTIQNRFKPDMQRMFNRIGLDIARNDQLYTNSSTSFTNTLSHQYNIDQQHCSPNSNLDASTYNTSSYTGAYSNQITKANQPAYHYSSQQQYNCNQSTVDSYYTLDSTGKKLALPEINHQIDYRIDHQMSDQRIENRMADYSSMRMVDNLIDSVLDNRIDSKAGYKLDYEADSWLETLNRNQSSKSDQHTVYLKSDECDLAKTNQQLVNLTKSSLKCFQGNGDFKSQSNLIANLDPTLATSFNSVSLPTNKPNLNGLTGSKMAKTSANSLKNSLMNKAPLLPEHHDLDTEISIIERNARVIKWLYNCKKYYENAI